MTLRHMKIYLAVYRRENITQAARDLCMTQPAVTRAIQEVEHYYGIRLFDRISQRLHVTQTGELFYSYALHIVDSFDQMEKSLRNWDELGMLRVGTSVTIGNSLLCPVLKLFRSLHPGLQIRSMVSNGTDLQQALLENRLDFALIEGGIQDDRLCREVIAADRLVLIMSPEDPRRNREKLYLQDFEGDDFLLREKGSVGRSLVDYVLTAHGITVEPMMESISTQAIIRGVHEGLGISFLPEELVRPALNAGVVVSRDLEDEAFVRENYLVWHRQKFLTGSAKALMDCFRQMSYAGKEA